MDQTTADAFATEWRDAWNSHDLDRILEHYADRVIFTSPLAVALMDRPDGTLQGIDELRAYFAAGLVAFPDLHFSPPTAYPTVDGVALIYMSIGGRMSCEVMQLRDGKVVAVRAHYRHP
jgi:ketosteroid isomerase-like protein